MAKSTFDMANCESCQHYRPQVSFVDAWKHFDDSGPRKEIMQSLKEVRQEETKTLENEVELLFELVKTDILEWPQAPRFAPYCGLQGKAEVAALRNRGGRCGDFTLATSRDERGCHTCSFSEHPIRRIGDRSATPVNSGGMRNEVWDRMRQIDKEMEDADAAAKGLEIEQSFFGDGHLPVVRFLPRCGARRTEGRQHVVPFCNLRRTCSDHSPWLPVPPELLTAKRNEPGDSAIDVTLELIQLVSRAGTGNPEAFMEEWPAWLESDPKHACSEAWASRGVARWWGMTGGNADTRPELSAPGKGGRLLPFIAGVDAFEWGWLAERSHSHPLIIANAIVQQLAEFLAATVKPLEAVRCIDSFGRVLDLGVFSDETFALVTPFARRLRALREDLWHTNLVDLISYYEGLAGSLLYAPSRWIRSKREGGQALADYLGESFVAEMREESFRKCSEARRQGMMLLSRLAAIEEADAQPPAAQFLDHLTQLNEAALGKDVQEQKDVLLQLRNRFTPFAEQDQLQAQQALATIQQKMFEHGLVTPDALHTPAQVDPLEQAVEQVFDPIRRSELPRRRLAAWLIFRRGMLPVTPSVLEFMKNAEPTTMTPQSIEQALLAPASKNVEAYFPIQGPDRELAAGRRIGSPLVTGAGN